MPVNGLLNYEELDHLTPLQQQMRNIGANGPTPLDQQDRTVSALVSVKPTSQDKVIHGGEVGLSDSTSYKVFMANLGYNLLVEYAEHRIQSLNPGQGAVEVKTGLSTLQKDLLKLLTLPVSQSSVALFDGMGLRPWAFKNGMKIPKLGSATKFSEDDRQLVIQQVPSMWASWWPKGLK